MKRLVCLALAAFFFFSMVSDIKATNESQAGALFLLIKPGVRVGAMGESFVTMSESPMASYYNPAGLSGRGSQIAFMHTKWLPALAGDLSYNFLAYSQYLEGWGNIGLNLTYLDFGEQVRTDERGNKIGTFTTYETALSVAYGTRISQKLSLGVTSKLIWSRLAPSGAGAERGEGEGYSVAFDFGALYKTSIPGLKFGASLHNLGPKIAYIDAEQADPLPLNFVIGSSYKAVDTESAELLFVLDFYKPLVSREDNFLKSVFSGWADEPIKEELRQVDIHGGLEYVLGGPNLNLALRAGYSYDKDGELKTGTFGFGLKYDRLNFDFAYLPAQDTPLQNNTRFSIRLGL